MDSKQAGFGSVDAYIGTFPQDIRDLLETVRATIRATAPDAQEKISYQMPTFAQNGNLVHFAAMKGYIGFYPTSSGIAAFQQELSGYTGTKGAVHFPINQPLPLDLISRIVRFRVAENQARAADKSRTGRK